MLSMNSLIKHNLVSFFSLESSQPSRCCVLGKSFYFQLLVEDLGKSGDVLSAFKASGFQPGLH